VVCLTSQLIYSQDKVQIPNLSNGSKRKGLASKELELDRLWSCSVINK